MGNELDLQRRKAEKGGLLAAIARNRLGNLLLVINTAYLVRLALLAPPIEWDYSGNWVRVGDPQPYEDFCICCMHPPLATVLYNMVTVPAWIALQFLEWTFRPAWDQLYVIVAQRLDVALFLILSGVEWLVVGYYIEWWWSRCIARSPTAAQLAIAPDAAQRRLFE